MFYSLQIYYDSVDFQEPLWDFYSHTNDIYICVGSLKFPDLLGYERMHQYIRMQTMYLYHKLFWGEKQYFKTD